MTWGPFSDIAFRVMDFATKRVRFQYSIQQCSRHQDIEIKSVLRDCELQYNASFNISFWSNSSTNTRHDLWDMRRSLQVVSCSMNVGNTRVPLTHSRIQFCPKCWLQSLSLILGVRLLRLITLAASPKHHTVQHKKSVSTKSVFAKLASSYSSFR